MTNIIRTRAVELTTIPGIAYKQKLTTGGAGIKIQRMDDGSSAVCTLDRRGELVAYKPYDEDLFPHEAFSEALELTIGLPYSARGSIKLVPTPIDTDDVSEEAPAEQIDMTLSDEYRAIIDRFSDEKGEFSHSLMNKDFMSFATKSKVVADMIGRQEPIDDIVTFIVKSRATFLSGKKESLDDAQVALLIETLDEIAIRSAFKELKALLIRMQPRKQR